MERSTFSKFFLKKTHSEMQNFKNFSKNFGKFRKSPHKGLCPWTLARGLLHLPNSYALWALMPFALISWAPSEHFSWLRHC